MRVELHFRFTGLNLHMMSYSCAMTHHVGGTSFSTPLEVIFLGLFAVAWRKSSDLHIAISWGVAVLVCHSKSNKKSFSTLKTSSQGLYFRKADSALIFCLHNCHSSFRTSLVFFSHIYSLLFCCLQLTPLGKAWLNVSGLCFLLLPLNLVFLTLHFPFLFWASKQVFLYLRVHNSY